jgi:hypothetical protein
MPFDRHLERVRTRAEIDRGTMPIVRANLKQTSFERKMRAYLSAEAARQHETHFGWKTFRVLTVTTDRHRAKSMIDALRHINIPESPGASLFYFDQRSDQTQQLYMLRPIASLTKECANLNVGRFSTRGHIGNMSDKNAP